MELGTTIRMLRKRQNRTQDDVASKCGFTVSLLSKIENGQTTPPVATLMKIAKALGVTVSDLLESEAHVKTVSNKAIEHQNPERWVKTDKGYSFFTFASSRRDKIFQPYLFIAKKDEVVSTPLSHDGQEFLYLLEGSMRYRVGHIEYLLEAGDSLYFDSLEEHTLFVESDEVRYLAVFSESAADGKN